MLKLFCVFGALLGFIGVAAGSFGAHGLKDILEANGYAANWETAVRYCLFHAVVLVAICSLANGSENAGLTTLLTVAAGCFVVGVLIFSGCLACWHSPASVSSELLSQLVASCCSLGGRHLLWRFLDFGSELPLFLN